jgi:quercetin dioxygenase-like cupin family protein
MKMSMIVATAATLVLAAPVLAQQPADVMKIVPESEVTFTPSATTAGIAQARIQGDPSVAGQIYIVRNKFSPNTFSAPHFHPEARYIQVLKGTWWVGSGPVQDLGKATPVKAGGFVVHHPGKIHWDGAKDEETIVQIMGIGPSGSTRVDENGQPKK